MSRRRKGSAKSPAGTPSDPPPDPPRPSKPLLWITGLALAAWIAVLVVLAVTT